ncbi:hypothetical protein C8034_v005015 [Colletotrichum sidae]|uniref:DUF7730 domain-containing protein n=1 Tax=Colletotrichum sidae TaxID=1347389 RepID=A0A4R8T7Q5_9PEZI|nr:hypothetical protein C8034_v005015 [Colletotrichum sidae]
MSLPPNPPANVAPAAHDQLGSNHAFMSPSSSIQSQSSELDGLSSSDGDQHYDTDADEVESQDGNDEDEDDEDDEGDLDFALESWPEQEDQLTSADDDIDADTGEGSSFDVEGTGCTTCRSHFKDLNAEIEKLQDRLRAVTIDKDAKVAELQVKEAKIIQLQGRQPQKSSGKRNTKRTWPAELQLMLANHPAAKSYKAIYKLCCREENMSCKLDLIHPNLRLRGPNAKEYMGEFTKGESPRCNEPESNATESNASESNDEDGLFVGGDDDKMSDGDTHAATGLSLLQDFQFERLEANVQANIMKHVFDAGNKLIHCISRLDPYAAPEDTTSSSGLLHRFHLSGSSCSLTYAVKPSEHLALLLVCKRWYFMGVHVFYGLNTFAFSSMGEFSSFCCGIGKARRERIQHVELLWIGNQFRCFPSVTEGKSSQPKYTSRRTWDISWLCDMPRLKTLTIHINESGHQYMRRRHEPSNVRSYLASVTAGQPNFRLTRSLRTLQGLDYIYQLRGMDFVCFFDFEKHLRFGGRHHIRDWSFVKDVETATALPKAAEKAAAAQLDNLSPVVRGFIPNDKDIPALTALYNQSRAFGSEFLPRPAAGNRPSTPDMPVLDRDIGSKNDDHISRPGASTAPKHRRARKRDPAKQSKDGSGSDDDDGDDGGNDDGGNDDGGNDDGGNDDGGNDDGGNDDGGSDDEGSDDGTNKEPGANVVSMDLDDDVTPRASLSASPKNARSDTPMTTSSNISEAGSTIEHPIDLDECEPTLSRARSTAVDRLNRELSIATNSSNGLFLRQGSADGWSYDISRAMSTSSHLPSPVPSLGEAGNFRSPSRSPGRKRPHEEAYNGGIVSFPSRRANRLGEPSWGGNAGRSSPWPSTTADQASSSARSQMFLQNMASQSVASSSRSSLPNNANFMFRSAPQVGRLRSSSAEEEESPFKKRRK